MNSQTSGGVGLASLLGVLFIGLKLTHYIDWRWRWVLAPFWAPMAAFLVFIFICLLAAAAVKAFL